MKKRSLVRIRKAYADDYGERLKGDSVFLFLGEIHKMPDHGIFVGMRTGKVYPGLHTFAFEPIPEEVL